MKKIDKKQQKEIWARETFLVVGIICTSKALYMIFPPLTWLFIGTVCLYVSGFFRK